METEMTAIKNVSHIGGFIRQQIVEFHGLNVTHAAKALGVRVRCTVRFAKLKTETLSRKCSADQGLFRNKS